MLMLPVVMSGSKSSDGALRGEEDDAAGREDVDASAAYKFGVDLTAPTQGTAGGG